MTAKLIKAHKTGHIGVIKTYHITNITIVTNKLEIRQGSHVRLVRHAKVVRHVRRQKRQVRQVEQVKHRPGDKQDK
jgi:hypothetical protein